MSEIEKKRSDDTWNNNISNPSHPSPNPSSTCRMVYRDRGNSPNYGRFCYFVLGNVR